MTMQNKRITASILFLLISIVCVAQAPPPPGPPPPPPGLPIDSGVIIALAGALFYGVKKLIQKAA